jgi:hypothetical protein
MRSAPKPYIFSALREKFDSMKPGAKKEMTHIYIGAEDIEQHSLHLAVKRFDVPAKFKETLETFKYHIPIFQVNKCAKIHGHVQYIADERVKKGIVHQTTKVRTQKFGQCVQSAHTLGMPSGTGLLVQEKHPNWVIGGTDYGDWNRLSSTCESHTKFNTPRVRPPATLPKSPFLVYTKV